jgi:hypothetical protein
MTHAPHVVEVEPSPHAFRKALTSVAEQAPWFGTTLVQVLAV